MMDIQSNIPSSPHSAAPLTPKVEKAIEAAKAAVAREAPAVSKEALGDILRQRIPEVRSTVGAKLQLDIDSETGMVIGRIMDSETGEMIKQIPTEDMLRLIATTKEQLGTFYDDRV